MRYKKSVNFVATLALIAALNIACSSVKLQKKSNQVPIISLKQLEKITQQEATLYIINFWATWCKPCVEELPYFEKINEKYKNKGVQTILVSLDFKEDLKEKVLPFIFENQLKSEVYLLDVEKQKGWIDQVNSGWSGAIPATIIQSKYIKNTFFKEGELSLNELEDLVETNYQKAIKNKLP